MKIVWVNENHLIEVLPHIQVVSWISLQLLNRRKEQPCLDHVEKAWHVTSKFWYFGASKCRFLFTPKLPHLVNEWHHNPDVNGILHALWGGWTLAVLDFFISVSPCKWLLLFQVVLNTVAEMIIYRKRNFKGQLREVIKNV